MAPAAAATSQCGSAIAQVGSDAQESTASRPYVIQAAGCTECLWGVLCM